MVANSRLLTDRIAIVTGGAGNGIGHGISFELAEADANVVIGDIDRKAGGRHVRGDKANSPALLNV